MSTPDSELYRLRHTLYGSGWEMNEIEDIIDQASRDVNEIVLDVVENAVAEAVDYAQDLGAEEFMSEIDVRERGGYFQIETISGNTNFSTPAREMLPDLIKDAPTSSNGNKNKVIPVGAGSSKIRGDMFSVMQDRQKKIQEARASLIESNLDRRSARATQMAHDFRSVLHRNLVAKQAERKVSKGNSANIEFRTASSTQDPSVSWVYPAKDMDMTGFLMDLNDRIRSTLGAAITQLIDSYIEEYG